MVVLGEGGASRPGPSLRPRVAVVGARGIGKHHAKWWALCGADVCAIVGTSPASVAQTRAILAGMFPFAGRGYVDVREMLDAERPEVVDVCAPTGLHYECVRAALEAGCHVLCEKPFVYRRDEPCEVILELARGLAELAARKGLRLAVCTQYSAGAPIFERMWREANPGRTIAHYHGHLESPAGNRPPDPERVWVDLAPHLIGVLLRIAPEGQVDWNTVHVRFDGYEATAEFEVRRPGAPPLLATIVTRNALEAPFHVRHFKLDGCAFLVEGENDAEGIYRARIKSPVGERLEPDMMHALIREFAAGRSLVSIEESIENLDIMLRIRDMARNRSR